MSKKAVCLISGGLDSCVTASIAKKQGYHIFAITFDYKQRHKKEIKCAQKIAKSLDVKKHIIFNIDLSQFKGSSLTDKSIQIEQDNKINEIGKNIPSTYVPARNTIFLSIALAFAEVNNCDAIFIGVTSTDYSGYPDCRPEYIKAFQKMINLATKRAIQGKKIKINTPLIDLSKKEIIKKGKRLNSPFEKTWSCYQGKEKACGRCDSCLLRLKGFMQAKLKDPIKYEKLPEWYN
jgi:7-cyano-7-deazaguanine synthase